MSSGKKSYVEIYNTVKFIKDNHKKLFPSEILSKTKISNVTLKKVAAELNLELLNPKNAKKTNQLTLFGKKKQTLFERIINNLKKPLKIILQN